MGRGRCDPHERARSRRRASEADTTRGQFFPTRQATRKTNKMSMTSEGEMVGRTDFMADDHDPCDPVAAVAAADALMEAIAGGLAMEGRAS